MAALLQTCDRETGISAHYWRYSRFWKMPYV